MEDGNVPCRDYDYGSYNDCSSERRKIDKLTAMLCSVLSAYNARGLEKLPREIQSWWRDHQEQDRRRLAAEAEARRVKRLKREAIKKLTPEERKLLNVRGD